MAVRAQMDQVKCQEFISEYLKPREGAIQKSGRYVAKRPEKHLEALKMTFKLKLSETRPRCDHGKNILNNF